MNIEDKIRKLFALAKDPGATENEAETALSMAQKLAMEYSVDIVKIQTGGGELKDDIVRFKLFTTKNKELYRGYIANALSNIYPCKPYWSYERREEDEGLRTVTLNLHIMNVVVPRSFEQAIKSTLDFISWQIDQEYREALKADPSLSQVQRRKEFLYGCCSTIAERAQTLKKRLTTDDEFARAQTGQNALVLAETREQILNEAYDFLQGEGVHLVRSRSRKTYRTSDATLAGRSAGRNVQFHRGLN